MNKVIYFLFGVLLTANVAFGLYIYTNDVDFREDAVVEDREDEEDAEDEVLIPRDIQVEEEEVVEEDIAPQQEVYSGPSFISLEKPLPEENFYEAPIVFGGVVSPDTQKISVKYEGYGMSGPASDNYLLTGFKPGDQSFVYRADSKWNNLAPGTNSYTFTATFADGSQKIAKVRIYFNEGGAEMGKPVIYLYPEKAMDVSVNVKPNGGFSVTEPAISENGWQVFATPKSEIFLDGKQYPYLFWEGFAANYSRPQEGFVVKRGEVEKFFDTKLSYLGMNEKEIADFKEFWVPRMQEKAYYLISFVPQAEFDKYAPLEVSPKPDTVIRVIFDHVGLDKPVKVKEQKLKKGVRNGFTVIEWGGRL